ncbi:MAG: hypothetical protein INR64_11700 [Caulobacteraceae bacterium]|nr:hypothetical protein [Caulobacter sp.]
MVNGSLWTMLVELNCYLLVLALGSFSLLKRSRGLVAAFVVVASSLGANAVLTHDATLTLWRFLFDFLANTVAFLYADLLPDRPAAPRWRAVRAGGVLARSHPVPGIVSPCVAYLLLRFGFWKPPTVLRWEADLSYGAYIYAFTVQQACVAALHLPALGTLLTLVSAPVVLALTWLSWNYVEGPAIARFRGRTLRPLHPASAHPDTRPQGTAADAPAYG